jgi:Tfp pilus assembly protein PilF
MFIDASQLNCRTARNNTQVVGQRPTVVGRLPDAPVLALAVALALLLPVAGSAQSLPSGVTLQGAGSGAEAGHGAEFLRLQQQGDWTGLEKCAREQLAAVEKQNGPDDRETGSVLEWLAEALQGLAHYSEAESLARRAVAIDEQRWGPQSPEAGVRLATVLGKQREYAEAEPLLRRALALSPENPSILNNLAVLLDSEGRFGEAQPLIMQSMVVAYKTLGPEHPETAIAFANVGANAIDQQHFADAVGAFRRACAIRSMQSRSNGQSAEAATAARLQATDCATRLSLSLWLYASQGGGKPPERNGPEAVKLEAFTASQQALQSAAGDAMAHSAALTAARAANVGPQAEAYEAALLARDEADATIDRLAAELKSKAPLYWDYRAPEPVTVAALQSRSGHRGDQLQRFRAAHPRVFALREQQLDDKSMEAAEAAAWAPFTLIGEAAR